MNESWPPASNKSRAMEETLDTFSRECFGTDRRKTCAICPSTKIGRDDFRDDLSRKEYGISRLCQACQDSIFGGAE